MIAKEKWYLTKKGLERIKEELKELKQAKFSQIQGEGPESFSFGNVEPEFLVFRQEVARLEERIAEIEDVLEHYALIKPPPKKERNTVHLGAVVVVEANGEVSELFIIGILEADPLSGRISDECPLGQALLGHRVGDAVEVQLETKMIYKIKDIRYEDL